MLQKKGATEPTGVTFDETPVGVGKAMLYHHITPGLGR